jgi:hypothetical protein
MKTAGHTENAEETNHATSGKKQKAAQNLRSPRGAQESIA